MPKKNFDVDKSNFEIHDFKLKYVELKYFSGILKFESENGIFTTIFSSFLI